VLALAAVHGELDGVAIGASEGFVAVEEGLDEVVAGRDGGEGFEWEAEGGVVDGYGRTWAEGVGIDAEDLLGVNTFADLEAGFCIFGGREEQEDAAIEGFVAEAVGDGDLEAEGLRCGGLGGLDEHEVCRGEKGENGMMHW